MKIKLECLLENWHIQLETTIQHNKLKSSNT